MIQYILECIAFQLLFMVIYDLFLKRETFFQWNRVYLIGTYVLSIVLPWVKIEAFKTNLPQEFIAYPEYLWGMNMQEGVLSETKPSSVFNISWEFAILLGGMVLAIVLFVYKMYQIRSLRSRGEVHYFKDFTRVLIKRSKVAFSFFKTIFMGDQIKEEEYKSIIQHELVHIKQKHSLDLLFFELMRIVGWFNPLVYIYQSRISELHEFIADSQVSKTHKKEHYQLLLSQVFQTQNISFVNPFFKSSLIKKRIVMLQKQKSKRVYQLKYLALVPMVVGMLFYTSSTAQMNSASDEQTIEDKELTNRITEEIKKEVKLRGTILEVAKNSLWMIGHDSNSSIFTKEEYFKSEILANLHFNELYEKLKSEGNYINDFRSKWLLPTTERYESYVLRKKAFNLLDENLKISIRAYEQNVVLLENNDSYPTGSYVLKVDDIKDFTGKEVKVFNDKMDEVFNKGNEHRNIVVTDGSYSFLVFKKELVETPKKDSDKVIDIQEEKTIPFAKVDEVPIFPNCKNVENKRACFNEEMINHIKKHFNYPKEAQEQGLQGRVNLLFTISSSGDIIDIKKRGPHELLENEAERIIKRLPKLEPGKKNGESVNVAYSIPITFKL